MDADEINSMVNRITSIWNDMMKPKSQHSRDAETNSFLREIKSNSKMADIYEQPDLLEQALEVIPIHEFYEKAETTCIDTDLGDLDDQIIKQLLHWFKNDFFQWVNEPPCDGCRSSTTRMVGHTQPNQQDLLHGASVVELYQCNDCRSYTRFPRYNDPAKLLQTKRGRCGEWANCFTLCCRAVGVDARLVLDKTDHVWTEIYSNYQRRWIHCDACEDAFDRPLMYSAGWNKEVTYCIAYSADEVVDVTRRYTRDWSKVLQRRRLVDEQQLSDYIAKMCQDIKQRRIVASIDKDRLEYLEQRHKDEQDELEKASLLPRALRDDDMLGRQSGSMAWRMLRGEQGKGTTCTLENPNVEAPEFKTAEKRLVFEHPTKDDMQLLGTATTLDQQIQLSSATLSTVWRLTTADPSQCGGVFRQVSMDTILSKGMETEFAFRITNHQGGPASGGADGMAFVIQANDTGVRLGQGGCELGYGGIKNSLAIEFDTYDSSDRCADPSPNHISVHGRLPPYGNSAHHDYSLKHTSAIPSLNSGDWIYCRVRYMAKTQSLEVALKETSDSATSPTDATNYITVLTLDHLDMRRYLNTQNASSSSNCWIGFTASTGGLAQNHDVCWFSLFSYF